MMMAGTAITMRRPISKAARVNGVVVRCVPFATETVVIVVVLDVRSMQSQRVSLRFPKRQRKKKMYRRTGYIMQQLYTYCAGTKKKKKKTVSLHVNFH